MKRSKPEIMTIKHVLDSIINSEPEWLEKNKPSLCFNHDGHDIEIPWECLKSAGWSSKHIITDPKFLKTVKGLLKHFKETDTDYLDSDGNSGKKQ